MNLLMVVGNEKTCYLFYSNNQIEMVQRFNFRGKRLIDELGKQYCRPVDDTIKLIRKKFGYHQKTPLFLDSNRILLFPTTGIKDNTCIWINYYAVSGYYRDKNKTVISFHDQSLFKGNPLKISYLLDIDIRVIRQQMRRCENIHKEFSKKPFS